jgi:hypothetical protein
MGVQGANRGRSVPTENMSAEELKSLLEETIAGLGGTDQSYVQLLKYLHDQNQLRMPSRLMVGQMVFFKYKPKDKRFLASDKAYDVFPLVIITDVHKNGFEGLNLHYISRKWRRMLFTAIENTLPVKRSNDDTLTRLGATYNRLNAARKFSFFKPCYRRYTMNGFRKRPIVIPSEFWDVLVDVDLALFVKGRKMGIRRMSYNAVIRGDNT